MNKSKALMALTQAALALPGVARADVSVDYLFSDYEEADLPAAHAASGQSSERYSIQSHLLRVVAPVWQQKPGMTLTRSEERLVGKGCASKCRYWWCP